MDKKYFVLKALKNASLLDKNKPQEHFSLSRMQTKQYQMNQKSMLSSVDADKQINERPSLGFDFRHRRNLSTDKQHPGSDIRLMFPKTS